MEETKFWTKGKIIFLCVVFVIILIIIGAIFIHKSSVKKQYVEFENHCIREIDTLSFINIASFTDKKMKGIKLLSR